MLKGRVLNNRSNEDEKEDVMGHVMLQHCIYRVVVGMIIMGLTGLGCSSGPSVPPSELPLQEVDGPEWLTQKGAAFSGDKAIFYGVGLAANVMSSTSKRRAAEAQARRDIAQTFNTYIGALNKQYLADTTAGSMEAHSVEQHIEDVMKDVAEATLVGVTIEQYWEHPHKNEVYALARLDLQRFLDVIEALQSSQEAFKELDAKMRDFVRKNAKQAHKNLNAELEKR